MITFSEFFEINNEIILFIYGLVFFILGFAIILQTRQSSRLELAHNLRWLAAFGIIHSFYEWGDLFIPIQKEYLSEATIVFLYRAHLVTLAVSFVCLLEFGLALLFPIPRRRWIHWQSLAILGVWLAIAFIVLPAYISDARLLHRIGNALARYFIQFPGGILAAYGLRVHAFERIAPLNVPKIVRTFQIAGVSVFLYTLVGGLIPPAVPFFPGNLLNTDTFTEFMGAPPMVFRSLIGLVITVALLRGLEIFDLETERRIEHLEQRQIVNAERERLARDLHDGAIQKVYTAGLLVESAARLAEPDTEMDKRLKRAVAALSDSILDLRRNLADLHAHSQTTQESLPELLKKIEENSNYNTMVNIAVKIDLPENKSISGRRAGHIFAIVNEAMSNTVRHASATAVEIHASGQDEFLKIEIKDDGAGMPAEIKDGYGLRNMRDRARLLNGKIEFINDKGLTISLEIPWND
jgi:signal transduction histidine kinase